jgi:hypothetical protein
MPCFALPCRQTISAFTYTEIHHSRPFVDLHRGATLNCQPTKSCPSNSPSPNNTSHLLSPSLPVHPERSHPAPAETREAAAQSHEPPPLPYNTNPTSPEYALFSHSVLLIYWQTCQKHTMSSVITVRLTRVTIHTYPAAELTFVSRCRPRPAHHCELR